MASRSPYLKIYVLSEQFLWKDSSRRVTVLNLHYRFKTNLTLCNAKLLLFPFRTHVPETLPAFYRFCSSTGSPRKYSQL